MTPNKTPVLLLGGTGEAAELNKQLADDPAIELVTSLAGRTDEVSGLTGEVLRAGFQEFDGLEAFLKTRQIRLVVDATHPYADEMTAKAERICSATKTRYLRLHRPEWQKQPDDNWIEIPDMKSAALACQEFERIFLSIGRQELSHFSGLKQKKLLIRSVMETGFVNPHSEIMWVQQKGPFDLTSEQRLLADHQIEVVVSKNSGGPTTYAKIEAARNLKLPVILVGRKEPKTSGSFNSIEDILSAIRLFVSA